MKVATFEAVVENGQIRLPASVRLPERAKVYVVIPGGESPPVAYIGSPRLARPEQAADFVKEVVESDLEPALGEQQRLAAEGHTESGGAAFLRRIEDLKKRHGGGVEFEPPRLHFVPVDPFAHVQFL